MSGGTLRIDFRRSIDYFVSMSDDAAKHYNVKIVEANLYVRKMTLNDDVVSAIEKICLLAQLPILTLKPLQNHVWLPLVFTVGNKKTFLPGNQSQDWLYV